MKIKLLGKCWNLVRKPLQNCDGLCDNPKVANKTITVDSRLKGQRELEILLHEMLHAVDWHKDEESFIEPVAEDIARALWRLGYRKASEPEKKCNTVQKKSGEVTEYFSKFRGCKIKGVF